jgi:hypothetical protein
LTVFHDRVAKFPDRIKNLYFLYAFVLRAVSKLSPYLAEYPYNLRDANEQNKLKVRCFPGSDRQIHSKTFYFGKEAYRGHIYEVLLLMIFYAEFDG